MLRILPRDAFNDANLLKCIGQLTLLILDCDKSVKGLTYEYDGEPFDIQQDESDGTTYVANIQFYANGNPVHMCRPCNSRKSWPLVMRFGDDEFYVFSNDGKVMPSFTTIGKE